MTLGLSKAYTPASTEIANSAQYNTDIAALFNALTGLEADTPTSSMSNFAVDATGKLYFDGGNNTYIYESAADKLSFVAGGTEVLRIVNDDIGIPATGKIFLDGVDLSGDSFIFQAASDDVRIIVGGQTSCEFLPAQVNIPATQKLYFDGGGDTYIQETGGNNLRIFVGGQVSCEFNAASMFIPSTQALYFDGGSSSNASISSATQGSGTTALFIGNGQITVSSDMRLKKDIENTKIDALKLIDELRVVDFDWNDKVEEGDTRKTRGRYTGMLAQEMIKVTPCAVHHQGGKDCELCNTGKECSEHTEPWQAQYEYVVPVLVKAVQDLNKKIKSLEAA